LKSLIRDPRRQEVSPLELLFDLVYAFAISQLSHHLLTHQSWTGAAESLVLYLAVYTAWGYTAWAANLVNTEHPRARRMLVVVMVLSMFMNASITRAFDDAGWVFVTGYLLIHVGRIAWLLTIGLDPVQQRHFTRTLIWIVTTSPLWIAGAATEHRTRLALWGLAAVVDLTGTVTAHPLFRRRLDSRRLTFATAHIGERCRLFLLIALGETILTTGAALVNAPLLPTTLLSGSVAVAGTIALWCIYFRHTEGTALRHAATSNDPMRTGRLAVYTVLAMVAGLVAVAVGDELVIAHPTGHTTPATILMIYGGPALYVAAQSWYMHTVLGRLPRSRPIGFAALVVTGTLSLTTAPIIAACGAAAILIAIAATDSGPEHTTDNSVATSPGQAPQLNGQ
jgi:low temperature requirement protein LtrA